MSRPKHHNLAQALAAVKSGELIPAEAARVYGIAKSSISRALSAKVCECCGMVIPKMGIKKPK